MFRTGVYDCLREEIFLISDDPTKHHRSTDDKHYSGLVKGSDEVQLRGNSVFSYDRRVVRSLRGQGRPGSLGCIFLTKLHTFVIHQVIHLA